MPNAPEIERLFESCFSLLEGANDALASFSSIMQTEGAALPGGLEVDSGALPGAKVTRFSIYGRPSLKLRRQAYTVVSNCRDSLDQAVFAAARCQPQYKKSQTATYFPFAKDESDFWELFNNKKRHCHVPDLIKDAIHSFKPWWDNQADGTGNDLFRTLGKLSGPNKHQVIIDFHPELMINHTEVQYYEATIVSTDPPLSVEFLRANGSGLLQDIARKLPTAPERTDFLVAVLPSEAKFKLKQKMQFAFVAAEASRFPSTPINSLLRGFVATTEQCVERIKSVCLKAVVA